MVKFFCDRCGTEVESFDALIEFSLGATERPNRSIWSWQGEVCQECYETMKEEITNRVLPLPATEENKKKGIRKITP
jgi:hypothetical protein